MAIGQRLKEERKRLKFTQMQLANFAETTKNSVLNYEKDTVNPTSVFFEKISAHGFDIQYILTGIRSDSSLTDDEKEVLALYRSASDAIKQAVKAVLTSGESGTIKTVHFGRNNNLQNSKIKISQ